VRVFTGQPDRDFAFFYQVTHREWRDDVEMYLIFARKSHGRVLELACGDGRILEPLARAGCRVTGVDNSPGMLGLAERRLSRLPVDVSRRLELVEADITNFDLAKRFPLIICPFNSYSLLVEAEDRRRCLRCMTRHLAPQGIAVIDIFNPQDVFLDSLPEAHFNEPHLDRTVRLPHGHFVRDSTSNRYDRRSNILWVRKTYELCKAGRTRTYVFDVPAKALRRDEACREFAEADLALEEVYGDYDRSPYCSSSRQMIYVLARTGGT